MTQNTTETKVPTQETFSALVATRVDSTADPLSTFFTRCGRPKTTDD